MNADDNNYDTKALIKWEWILQDSSSKYREGTITIDYTPAMWVAYNVRQLVDPYTKLTSHHLTTALPSTTLSQDPKRFTQYTQEDCVESTSTESCIDLDTTIKRAYKPIVDSEIDTSNGDDSDDSSYCNSPISIVSD